jgi:hypothetical protein
MRGYTPWRVEEVGKLHHDAKVRIMKDSKVCKRNHRFRDSQGPN